MKGERSGRGHSSADARPSTHVICFIYITDIEYIIYIILYAMWEKGKRA